MQSRLGLVRFVRGLFNTPAKRNWQKIAERVNAHLLNRLIDKRRFRHFQCRHAPPGGHFYIIVVPGTLHFLQPALALLKGKINLLLIVNGLQAWEHG